MDPARRPKDAREWEATLRTWVPRKGDQTGGVEIRALDADTAQAVSPPTVSHAVALQTPAPEATPAAPPEPVAPGAATVALAVPGTVLARPADAPNADWAEVAKLPGPVSLVPNLVYCLRLKETVADADLAGALALPARAPVRHLNLSWCAQLTDAGLAHLKDLGQLQGLELTGCKKVTDAGLALLAALTALEHLTLRWCAVITDTGLARLKPLTALRHLDLMGCGEVTDAGLAHMRGFARLTHLDLTWCEQITDAGLARLTKLAHLRHLSLCNCPRLTDAGVAKLKAALPKCKVER
jgi:hypothetical protein